MRSQLPLLSAIEPAAASTAWPASLVDFPWKSSAPSGPFFAATTPAASPNPNTAIAPRMRLPFIGLSSSQTVVNSGRDLAPVHARRSAGAEELLDAHPYAARKALGV